MEKTLKNKAITGILWKLLERGGTQGIQLITTVVLARLIDPDEYGPLTVTTIFISIATILVQRGFGMALIQRKDVDDVDFSGVFFLGLAVAAALGGLFYVGAPLIARFYQTPAVTDVLRVLSLTLFFGAAESVLNAVIVRRMEFRQLFLAALCAAVVSGGVGIALACLGYGVWALVAQQLLSTGVMVLVMWLASRWKPKRALSLPRLRALFAYGWKLLLSGLIDTLYHDVSGLIIGKLDNTELLAHYAKGRQFPQFIGSNLNSAVQEAMFPAYSKVQDELSRMRAMLRRSLSAAAFLMFPLLVGLAAVAEPLVSVLLTDKWLPCVPFLRIACATYAMYPLESTGLHALNALGRSDIYLRLELVKKGFGVTLLALSAFVLRSAAAIALSIAVTGVFSVIVNAFPLKKLLGYRMRDQLADVLPSLLLALLMGGAVYLLQLTGLAPLALLLCQLAAGAALYIGGAFLLRLAPMRFLLESARGFLSGRRAHSAGSPEV